MKRGLTAVLAGALAAVLLVPAAGAKPGNGNGNGNGNGHGPPAWAGGGGGGGGGGKPDWAGQQGGKSGKAERGGPRAAADETGEDVPKHMNPAWICKFEREHMTAEAFVAEYGENENGANAFGKCVSREAHDRDGLTDGVGEAPTSDEETSDSGDSTDEESGEESALPASVQAFLHALWPFFS